jgi:hypothetical protein
MLRPMIHAPIPGPTDTQRVLEILARSRPVPIERDGEAADDHS